MRARMSEQPWGGRAEWAAEREKGFRLYSRGQRSDPGAPEGSYPQLSVHVLVWK